MSNCKYVTAASIRTRKEGENNFMFYWNECGYEGNAVTNSIIQACRVGCTINQLVTHICKEFQIDYETAKTDIEKVVQQLHEIGILISQHQGDML